VLTFIADAVWPTQCAGADDRGGWGAGDRTDPRRCRPVDQSDRPGANHAPQEQIDKYQGVFDDGAQRP